MKLNLKELISKLVNAPIVIEEGTDGIWTYRKWSNGTSECWARKSESVSCIVISSPWIRGTMSSTSFPSGLFNSTPTVLASGFGAEWVSLGTTTSTSISDMYIYTVATGTATRYVWLYAIGKWK